MERSEIKRAKIKSYVLFPLLILIGISLVVTNEDYLNRGVGTFIIFLFSTQLGINLEKIKKDKKNKK